MTEARCHNDTLFDAAQTSSATTRLDFQDGIIPPWNIEHFESMNKIPLILLFLGHVKSYMPQIPYQHNYF